MDSIAADKNSKFNVFKFYSGITEKDFDLYCKNNETKKIAVTYDYFSKFTEYINTNEYRVLIDEYHLLLQQLGFREDTISNLFKTINKYEYVTYLTATPFDCKYEIKQLRTLDHYEIEWEREMKVQVARIKTSSPIKGACKIIQDLLNNSLVAPNKEGALTQVKELYVFLNSVSSIKQILDTISISPKLVKICCANKIKNRKVLGNYTIESVTTPNKKVNLFTSKCFQGCNLFTNNGLVVVISDSNKMSMVTDLSSDLVQIAGRIRINKNYNNCFRNFLVHIYNTNNNILTDEEFEQVMATKKREGNELIKMTENYTEEQMNILKERINLSTDVVNIENNKMVFSPLKDYYFRYWQDLKKSYKDGISVCNAYNEKFIIGKQQYIKDFEITLAKKTTVSYQQLIEDYYENFNPEYETEYPEFKEYKKYLTFKNLKSLRFNKEKALAAIKKKKQTIAKIIKLECKTYTKKELKEIIGDKASLVENYFFVKKNSYTYSLLAKKFNTL